MKNLSILNDSEKKYKEFCDRSQITSYFLHQSPDSFSEKIRKNGGKRPDFHHITPMGDFYVDVKTSKLDRYPKFVIDLEDFNKLNITEGILRKPIFLAYPIDPWKGEEWGYIPISKVKKLKEQQQHCIEKGYKWIGIEYHNLKRYDEIIECY